MPATGIAGRGMGRTAQRPKGVGKGKEREGYADVFTPDQEWQQTQLGGIRRQHGTP